MDTLALVSSIESCSEIRLPWHKPLVERLLVTLDTRSALGSVDDSAAFEA